MKNKFRNVTTRKKRESFSTANYSSLSAHDVLPLTLEDRLRNIASIYTKIPADRAKKIAAAKQIPPESYKKSKTDYDQSSNINIEEVKKYELPPNDDEFWYKNQQN